MHALSLTTELRSNLNAPIAYGAGAAAFLEEAYCRCGRELLLVCSGDRHFHTGRGMPSHVAMYFKGATFGEFPH